MKYWLYGSCCLALAGCQTFMPTSRVVRLPGDDGYVVMHQAGGRSAYMVERDGQSFICSEPVPDVGLNSTFTGKGKGSSTAPQIPVSVEGEAGQTTTVVALAGRTENVLLLRDMFYYACLNRANQSFSNDQVFEAYKMTVSAVRDMALAERTQAAAGFVAAASAAGVDDKTITTAVQNLTTDTATATATTARTSAPSPDRHDIQAIPCTESPDNTQALIALFEVAQKQRYGWLYHPPAQTVSGHPGFHKSGVTLYYDTNWGERTVADTLARDLRAKGLPVSVQSNTGASEWMISASICMAAPTSATSAG